MSIIRYAETALGWSKSSRCNPDIIVLLSARIPRHGRTLLAITERLRGAHRFLRPQTRVLENLPWSRTFLPSYPFVAVYYPTLLWLAATKLTSNENLTRAIAYLILPRINQLPFYSHFKNKCVVLCICKAVLTLNPCDKFTFKNTRCDLVNEFTILTREPSRGVRLRFWWNWNMLKRIKKMRYGFFYRPKNGLRGWKLPPKFALKNRFVSISRKIIIFS